MSRSGYSDDLDSQWEYIIWSGQVTSAMNGARGQKLLVELRDALDAMPVKRLVENEFEASGEFCTLGVIAHAKGVKLDDIDPDDSDCGHVIGKRLDIAHQLAREIMYLNDEGGYGRTERYEGAILWFRRYVEETPEARWQRMRGWVEAHIKKSPDQRVKR